MVNYFIILFNLLLRSPCTLDIVVYGCLALLEHVPFANELVNSYKGHHSLVAHCQRIDKCLKYLVVTPQSPKNNEVSTVCTLMYLNVP